MIASLWCCALTATPSLGQQAETNVKVAFIYSFGRYVEWPPETWSTPEQPFTIAVCGEDPFGQALDHLATIKRIQERPISVRRFTPADKPVRCQILFVSRNLTREERLLLIETYAASGSLLVGESPGFMQEGGAVNFFLEGDRVRFEINLEAARRQRLQIDARLSSLGKVIDEQAPSPQ